VSDREYTALIADDEPLLREALANELARAWPELRVVAHARNGREALKLFEEHQPDVCFLDVQMPGTNGVEVARKIGTRSQVVFVTAYDQYAVEAFTEGALDYLVKPVEPARLALAVTRLRERLAAGHAGALTEALLQRISEQIAAPRPASDPPRLKYVHAQVGRNLTLIRVEAIDYLRSDTKYTRVAWRDEQGEPQEALLRTPLREVLEQLDPEKFAQVHRSVVVNLDAIERVVRDDGETATLHLRARKETLPVSRTFLPRFRQM